MVYLYRLYYNFHFKDFNPYPANVEKMVSS